jgi:hypothetical protein
MSVIKIMQREQILLRLAVLIFSGGVINSALLLLTIIKESQELQTDYLYGKAQIPFITTAPELTLLYLGFGILFSLGASFSFYPRRIVSPFYIQFVTASILLTILYTFSFVGHPVVVDTNLIQAVILAFLLTYGLLAGVGVLQGYVLRRLIGVNGNRENIDIQTYSITASHQNLMKIVTARKFLYDNDLFINKSYTDSIVLQSTLSTTEKHAIVLIPHPTDKEKTILAITSYLIRYDWLQTPSTTYGREKILGVISRILETETKTEIKIESIGDDKVATNIALDLTLKATTSPLGNLRNLPKRRAIVFSSIVLVAIVVSGIHFYDSTIINNDEFINGLIFIVISAVLTVVPLIREKTEHVTDKASLT